MQNKQEIAMDLVKNSLDERGLPVFGVIKVKDESGNTVEAYKQEKMFDREDYLKAAEYQRELASRHKELALYYASRAEELGRDPF